MPSLLWLPPPSSASLPDSSSDHSPASSSSPQQPEQCIYWRMKHNWIQLWLSINCYWIVDYNRLILKKCNFTVQSMEMHLLFWKRFIELLLRYLELMNTTKYLLAFKAKFIPSVSSRCPPCSWWRWLSQVCPSLVSSHSPSPPQSSLTPGESSAPCTPSHSSPWWCHGLGCHQELRLCSVLISLIRDQ